MDTVGERIVLYILNRIIYRTKESSSEEIPFLCHGEKDHAKILWVNGEAVGFYSVKATGMQPQRYTTLFFSVIVIIIVIIISISIIIITIAVVVVVVALVV